MKPTKEDIKNYVELIAYFNMQSSKCNKLYDQFMLSYGNNFKKRTSSVAEVIILVFLIDYISVTR
jgi:hypothetical protein